MKYCVDCGFVGKPIYITPGTRSMEVGLWLFFVVPGIIFSAWRRLASYQECALCGKRHIVPKDSLVAQAALRKLSPPPAVSPWFCTACGEPIFSGGSFCERCEALSNTVSEQLVQLQV